MKLPLVVALAMVVPSTASAETYAEHDYILSCSGCHRADGTGSKVVPSLQGLQELAGKPGAREYLIRVPGTAQAPLSDERLATMMNWLLKRFTGTAPKPRYTREEVGELRRRPFRDPIAERAKVLNADAGAGAGAGAGAE